MTKRELIEFLRNEAPKDREEMRRCLVKKGLVFFASGKIYIHPDLTEAIQEIFDSEPGLQDKAGWFIERKQQRPEPPLDGAGPSS